MGITALLLLFALVVVFAGLALSRQLLLPPGVSAAGQSSWKNKSDEEFQVQDFQEDLDHSCRRDTEEMFIGGPFEPIIDDLVLYTEDTAQYPLGAE